MKLGGREKGVAARLMAGLVVLLAMSWSAWADGILPNGLADPRQLFVNLNSAPADGQTVSLGSLNFGAGFGLDGSGVKIGIIADSFDTGSAFLTPGNVVIVNDDHDVDYLALGPGGKVNPTNTGNAMYQVLNAIAPGAQYYFHSAFNNAFTDSAVPNVNRKVSTSDSMVTAIDVLKAQGVDIIVDATGYRNEPWFQLGGNPAIRKTIGQAVDQAKAAGIAYFTPASTDDSWSYEASFDNSAHLKVSGYELHRFNAGGGGILEHTMKVTVPFGSTLTVALQWNDEFESLRGVSNGGDGDFDMMLFAETLPGAQAVSTRMQASNGDLEDSLHVLRDGQTDLDPWELLSFTNDTNQNPGTQTNNFYIAVGYDPGQNANPLHDLKLIISGEGVLLDDPGVVADKWTNVGHSSALGAITIASFGGDGSLAIDPSSPQVGDPVDGDSGLAGATLRFDQNGNPIIDTRYLNALENPMLAGLDDFDLSHIPDLVARGLGTFDGTAAAATYVAGVTALLVEAAQLGGNPLTVDEIYQLLADTAIDLETLGFDALSGDGLISPSAALSVMGEIPVPEPATMVLLAVGLSVVCLGQRGKIGNS